MENGKDPKWEIGETILASNEAFSLATMYRAYIEDRLLPDELAQLDANKDELEKRRSGQTESLITQKSSTKGKEEAINELNDTVIGIRNIVRGLSNSGEISQAYGVGERITKTISSVTASANTIVTAYKKYTEWSNSVGIIESDINEISALIASLSEAGSEKEGSVFSRKSKTMDKKLLQRAVEDEVTKLSAIGALVFRVKNPAVAAMFEGLIPSAQKTKAKPQAGDQTNP